MQNVQHEFRGRGGQHAYNTIMLHTQPGIPSSLKFKWAAPEMVEGALYDDKGGVCTSHCSVTGHHADTAELFPTPLTLSGLSSNCSYIQQCT